MTYPVIYLLRHGQTEWNVASRLQGRFDSALTDLGHAQVARQGELLAPILNDTPEMQVFCSPQGRAQMTAEIALAGHPTKIHSEPDLREITAGSWDGTYLDDIERSHGHLFEQARNAFELMFLAPDGEGELAVLERCRNFLHRLDEPAILVTHGATLCVLRGLLRGLRFEDTLDLSHEQGCIYRIENGEETILR